MGVNLHRQYHAMTAEQRKSVASSLEDGLTVKWDHAFETDLATWVGLADYSARTTYMENIMAEATQPAAGSCRPCYAAYQAAKTANDKKGMAIFDRRIAARLAAGLD